MVVGLVWGYAIWGTHQVPITKNYFKIQLRSSKTKPKQSPKPLPNIPLSVTKNELNKLSKQLETLV